jgi:hypothetical protein
VPPREKSRARTPRQLDERCAPELEHGADEIDDEMVVKEPESSHRRDLGEPFDFSTWFEYAPDDARAVEELLARLRDTEEWKYVERETDVRLILDPS